MEAASDLARDGDQRPNGQRALSLQPGSQGLARDESLRDVEDAADLSAVEDRHHVRVGDLARKFGLPLETTAVIVVGGELRPHQLERHAVLVWPSCLIYAAHSALAQ